MSASRSAADWAERYIERFGFALTPLEGKRPYLEAWNTDPKLIRDGAHARRHWRARPADNIGAVLEPSGLVSLDADYSDGARAVLAAEGIDLDALIGTTPTIVGRAPRLEFKAPAAPLSKKAVTWPARSPGSKPVTVLELRAGRVQDVLPPSVHPDTRAPYTWLTPPRNGFPLLPESLLALWLDDAFRLRARNRCPWADPEPEPRMAAASVGRWSFTGSRPAPVTSVIAAFNEAHDAVAILEAHGYVRAGRKRWKSPQGHGVAGVVLLPSGRVYCHHASDPLGDEKAHDAFDLFALFDHAGDTRAAVRAAAELLGMGGRNG